MRWYDPRLVLALTVPVVFLGILVGTSVSPNAVMDATVAGGLIAILGAIVNGILNQDKKDKDDNGEDQER